MNLHKSTSQFNVIIAFFINGVLLTSGCLEEKGFESSTKLVSNSSSSSSQSSNSDQPFPIRNPAPVEVVLPPSQSDSGENISFAFPIATKEISKGVLDAVPTFESIGLYFSTPNGSKLKQALVRYRALGASRWKQGHSLWFDERSEELNDLLRTSKGFSKQYRGSLVQLKSNTEYEIEILLNPSGEFISKKVKTWSETKPISKVIEISSSQNEPLIISESGNENGYILYKAKTGEMPVIDVQRKNDYNVWIKGSYVIVRGLTLKNSAKHGILIGSQSRNIIIEDNDISGWGRIAPDPQSTANGWGMNLDSAISTDGKANGTVTQLIIQRNKMHDPRSTANNWDQPRQDYDEFEMPRFSNGSPVMNPHPVGPQAITLTGTSGNHVIRYNRIFSSDPIHGTKLNDGIGGGGSNFTTGGAPGRDSDIYGNEICDTWDDGIESEGGNINVRIWSNYIHHTYMSIAVSPVAVGPLYIFRNIAGHTRRTPTDLKGGNFIKGQSRIQEKKIRDPKDPSKTIQVPDFIAGGGRVYVYHNTTVGQLNVGISRSSEQLLNYVSRNNILQGKETAIQAQIPLSGAPDAPYPKFDPHLTEVYKNDFDNDLYFPSLILTESKNNVVSPIQFDYEYRKEQKGIKGAPIYDTNHSEVFYHLQFNSPGVDSAEIIPGFNDFFADKAPDIGAQERGLQLFKIGGP